MCFTVNYVMGTGFLTLPWAFQSSGIGLAILTLTFVGYVSNISKDYVLEAMARAEMLKEKKEGEESLMLPPADDAEKSEHTLPLVKQRKVRSSSSPSSLNSSLLFNPLTPHSVRNNRNVHPLPRPHRRPRLRHNFLLLHVRLPLGLLLRLRQRHGSNNPT